MAKVKLNPILEQIRGQVGDLVFKRCGDEVVISRKPDLSDVEWSVAQVAHRERFRQATLYGKMVVADPATKVLYDEVAEARGKPVFALIVADFFNAPTVEEVDLSAYGGQSGDEIVVQAADDFDVVGVQVGIADAAGSGIEMGEATETPTGSGRWVYAATVDVPAGTSVRIGVAATDRPGGAWEAVAEKTV
jgi:hypothetical protein